MPPGRNPWQSFTTRRAHDRQMATFARWTNLPETTFLLRPTRRGADCRVCIFTPGGGSRRSLQAARPNPRQKPWRARCMETCRAGSASGLRKRTSSNAGTAPQADSSLAASPDLPRSERRFAPASDSIRSDRPHRSSPVQDFTTKSPDAEKVYLRLNPTAPAVSAGVWCKAALASCMTSGSMAKRSSD
jgi:hypothetical protein